MLAFIQKNWFSLGAVIFSTMAFVTQTHAMALQVAALNESCPKVDARVALLEQEMAARTQTLQQMSDDIRAMRTESEHQARSVAALCQVTGARCFD